MNRIIKFPGGLRLALYSLPYTKSVSVGIFVGVGSAYESKEQNGMSHFIEHMLFKGTENRSAFRIADEMESLGIQINAYTTRNSTAFYTYSLDEYAPQCFDVLADIFFRSKFDPSEIEKEKGVVLEEISMCMDDPSDRVGDLGNLAFFGGSGHGLPILGPAENVSAFTAEGLKAYMSSHYTADNTVIVVAGRFDPSQIIELTEKYFTGSFKGKNLSLPPMSAQQTFSRLIKEVKPIEQVNMEFDFPACPFNAPEAYASLIACNVLGDGMSSRLFQKIREELGLVYEISCFKTSYPRNGVGSIFIGTGPANVCRAVDETRKIINKFVLEGVTQSEFDKCGSLIRTGLILGSEHSLSVMRTCGRQMLYAGKLFDPQNELKELSAVTVDDVNAEIANIFDFERMSAAYVGPEAGCDVLSIMKGGK